jgi:hypothetical protein
MMLANSLKILELVKVVKLDDLLFYIGHRDINVRSIVNWRLNTKDEFSKRSNINESRKRCTVKSKYS